MNNLGAYPHAFVLGCLMDRQIKSEIAWEIPYKIKQILGSFEMEKLSKISMDEYKNIFKTQKLHKFNDAMSKIFCMAVLRIKEVYNNDASMIWANKPSSSTVVYRFLEFKGAGIKIATMAANILAREFCIEFSDYYSIDISPDVHIKRVMKRLGFVPEDAKPEMLIYKARELNPEYPGIIDLACWRIGKDWCKEINPDCKIVL